MSEQVEVSTAPSPSAPPAWFWICATAALLFEALGCFMFVTEMAVDHSSLPLDQRTLWDATPTWILAAYAVAVAAGLVGALLLLMRRRHAVPVLLVSLVAVLVQFGGLFVVPQLRQTLSDSDLIAPIAIIVVCYGLFIFARLAARRGWLK